MLFWQVIHTHCCLEKVSARQPQFTLDYFQSYISHVYKLTFY